MRGCVARYSSRSLANEAHLAANVEAIVDAFGFCAAHGAMIARLAPDGPALRAVLCGAGEGIVTLLRRHGLAYEDRLLGMLFVAHDACPACRYESRSVATPLADHAARLRACPDGDLRHALCMPHFLALLGESGLGDLASWIAAQRATLDTIGPLLDAGPDGERGAARMLVGTPQTAHLLMPAEESSTRGQWHCSVCLAVRRALHHWLEAAREGARVGIATWSVLPSCPQHIWMCRLSGDARLSSLATRHGLEAAADTLGRAAAFIEREEHRLERESRSVWFRRKSPVYHLALRRRAARALPSCVTCEYVAVARDRAISEAIERLAGEHGGGVPTLCLKHFAQARIITPAGPQRERLTAVLFERLQAIGENGTPAALRLLAGHA